MLHYIYFTAFTARQLLFHFSMLIILHDVAFKLHYSDHEFLLLQIVFQQIYFTNLDKV